MKSKIIYKQDNKFLSPPLFYKFFIDFLIIVHFYMFLDLWNPFSEQEPNLYLSFILFL